MVAPAQPVLLGHIAPDTSAATNERVLLRSDYQHRQRIRRKPPKDGSLVIVRIEAVGTGVLQARNDGLAARIFHALLEPQRRQVALLIEGFDRRLLGLASEDPVWF